MLQINNLKKYIFNPAKLVVPLGSRGYLKWVSDKKYLEIAYRSKTGKKIDLNNPKTFNEKLQWLKLYNRRPEYTVYADKYAVRSYIANTIGEEYLIPLIAVYDSVDEINWEKLPKQFALKYSHGSGTNIICKDRSELDIRTSTKKLKKWMKMNWFWFGREWPYTNIKPKILCEKYIVDGSGKDLKDYKFMCFNGVPKLIHVISERKGSHHFLNYFNLDWKEVDLPREKKKNPSMLTKPIYLEKMIEISKTLSQDIPFVRIDLYSTEYGIYFGEITFFPTSGYIGFAKEEDDALLGSWIRLP